jgi:hypothetical protein
MSEYGVPSKDFIGQRSSPRFLFVAGVLGCAARTRRSVSPLFSA